MGEEMQRARILRAIAEEMAAREDPHAVTVADVVARAGVSRRVFYELYADRDACFLAAFEWGLELGAGEMYAAYAREARWHDGVRAALAALLGLLDREPALARLCIVYALGAGGRVQQRRMAAIETIHEFVDRGRLEGSGRTEPPEVAAEGVVGAVLAVIHTRLLSAEHGSSAGQSSSAEHGSSGERGPSAEHGSPAGQGFSGKQACSDAGPRSLSELLGPLMNLILLPYMGAAKASRELTRPAPRAATAPGKPEGVASGGLNMRLTYRTARVLRAIGERPGASNREVADQAGIVDQGQISRLLSRLESLGLIANTGGSSSRGMANAWVLTPRGEEVERSIQASTLQTPSSGELGCHAADAVQRGVGVSRCRRRPVSS
jgi:AcrR family transcriptional regulator/DNA-binding MarR family transcriptional regulator